MQIIAKKAFTLVEVMIIIIVIGLLAAMAIPAFHKVRINSLAKSVARGETISDEQRRLLEDNLNHVNDDLRAKITRRAPSVVEISVDNFQTIVINGKTYKLVPQ